MRCPVCLGPFLTMNQEPLDVVLVCRCGRISVAPDGVTFWARERGPTQSIQILESVGMLAVDARGDSRTVPETDWEETYEAVLNEALAHWILGT